MGGDQQLINTEQFCMPLGLWQVLLHGDIARIAHPESGEAIMLLQIPVCHSPATLEKQKELVGSLQGSQTRH